MIQTLSSTVYNYIDLDNSYLIFDSAQKENFLTWLYQLSPTVDPFALYRHSRLEGCIEVSPYLIKVLSAPEVMDYFFMHAHKDSLGIIIECNAPKALFEHLKNRLFVSSPLSEQGIFRWYDPRICLGLIQKSTSQELAQLLGPISKVCVPSSANNWTVYSNSSTQAPWQPLYKVSDKQWQALHDSAEQTFKNRVLDFVCEHYPQQFLPANQASYNTIEHWLDMAKKRGFINQLSAVLFINILALAGEDILANESHPVLFQLLNDSDHATASERIKQANEIVEDLYSESPQEQTSV